MLENQGNNLTFLVHYAKDGASVTGLTVTVDIYEIAHDGTTAQPVDDGACTEVGNGLYKYVLAAASVDANAEYPAVFHTAGDVDQADIPSLWSVGRAGTPYLDAAITSRAVAGDLMGLANDAITAGKFDESTAYPVKSADTGATQIARVGADADTLETLSDQVDAVTAKTNNLPSDPADQSALEALFTAIKGAGWTNQTLVAIKAATDAISAAAIADAVWDETTASHVVAGSTGKALGDAGAAGDPWSAAVRTLTQTAAQAAAAMTGSSIICHRGDDLSTSLTGLGSLVGRSKLWFTVKKSTKDTDAQAIIQIEETLGLAILNGAAYVTTANGDITVTDATAGNVTIPIKGAATALLLPDSYQYDVQVLIAGVITTKTASVFEVTADVTRAVS